jgi:hypothetical protein
VCAGRPRRAPRRLDHGGRRPEPESFEQCLALLEQAIARAERWCAHRERALADFDLRATEIVRRLHNAGVLASSTTWTVG